jgi:hypothetical protein
VSKTGAEHQRQRKDQRSHHVAPSEQFSRRRREAPPL